MDEIQETGAIGKSNSKTFILSLCKKNKSENIRGYSNLSHFLMNGTHFLKYSYPFHYLGTARNKYSMICD